MVRLCRACDGPVCPICGGCIGHGGCSCVSVQQLQITPELLYQAHHIVSPGEWAKGQPPMSEAERVKFTIMADWLNKQLAQPTHAKLSDVPLDEYLTS